MTTHRFPRLLLLGLAVAASRCGAPAVEDIETATKVPVEVQAARVDTIESRIEAAGVVTPAPGADFVITAPEAARIAEIPKAEGESVRAGDVLVRFDIPSLAAEVAGKKADLAQAQARVESTRAAVTRLTGLVDRGIAARREVEEARRDQAEAEAAVARAQGEVAAALTMAERAVVTARFAGVVAKRWHNAGDLVEASSTDPILRVIDPRELEVVASIPAVDAPRVVVGRKGLVTGPGADEPEEATVIARPTQIDAAGSVAPVRLAFKGATRWTSGTPVQVAIVADQHAKVIVVPALAIVRDGGDTFVMVAGTDDVAHRKAVTLGLVTGDLAEVSSGVAAGDRVIVRGQGGLPDGAAVTVKP